MAKEGVTGERVADWVRQAGALGIGQVAIVQVDREAQVLDV